jgi:hypothetical protein
MQPRNHNAARSVVNEKRRKRECYAIYCERKIILVKTQVAA